MSTELAIGVTVLKRHVPEGAPLEDQLRAVMEAARKEIWFTVDEDTLFRIAVGTVMQHHGQGSEEWRRLEHEIKTLQYLSAGVVVGNLDRMIEHANAPDAPEPIGLMKIWKETASP